MIVGGLNTIMMAKKSDSIPQDFIAHYTMDNISDNTLVDETGTYDGTITGAVPVAGHIGNALSFDGVNDHVDIVNTAMSNPQEMAISFWFNADVLGENDTLIDSVNGWSAFILRFNSSQLKLYSYTGSVFHNLTHSVSASTLYHIVLQHENSGATTLHVDGVLVGTTPNHSIGYKGDETGRRIGWNAILYPGRSFDGWIDQYYEYDRILTQAEIIVLANES